MWSSVFFFNDPATTEIYTLSLHDALPISRRRSIASPTPSWDSARTRLCSLRDGNRCGRSEEHTSELQSHSDLVCRLLLEKKNQTTQEHPERQKESPHTDTR